MKTSYYELEGECEHSFQNGGPYWHICTDGNGQELIFSSVQDFIAGMNIIALILPDFSIKIIAFILMNNHVHFITEGSDLECVRFFATFKKKLDKYLDSQGRPNSLKNFECGDPLAIESLEGLRTEIVYVHRNMYVVRQDILPYTYPWGSGRLFFNPVYEGKSSVSFNSLPYEQRRTEVFFGRVNKMPDNYLFAKGFILPESYIDIKRGESFFRHASHYFNSLSKPKEDISVVAKRLGDSIVLNDEEFYQVAASLASTLFNNPRPQSLPFSEKKELARKLRYNYFASNKTISRVLKFDLNLLEELYPSK